jgi:uncharacterized delta-60 repeat protein
MKTSTRFSGPVRPASILLLVHAFAFGLFGAAGDVDLSFDPGPGVNGQVNAVVVQPDGKILIAGHFTTVKGLMRTNLARLNADGTGDATFDANLTMNSLTALALQPDGKLLVGGQFYQPYCDEFDCYDYYAATMVRLNANGSQDVSFTPATAEYFFQSGNFRSLVPQSDGRILVGGEFSSLNGTNRIGIARLNATGTMDTSFNTGVGPNGPVQFVALQPDNKALIGGRFTTFDGTNCSSLARLNANGTLDTSFNPDFGVRHYWNCEVVCYTVSFPTATTLQPDGKVLVGVLLENWQCDAFEGGCFVSQSYFVTRLNADGSSDPSFVFTNVVNNAALLGSVSSMAVQSDDKIVIGSSAFNTVRIARLNSNGSWDDTFNPGIGPSGSVNAVALQADGNVLIGGGFTMVNGVLRPYVARLYGDSTAPSLSIGRPNGFVIVSWPVTDGFVLDQSLAVTSGWSQVPFPYITNGNRISVSAAVPAGNKFYRLRKP